MRQVPLYLVIGSGRMATHFCHYLSLLNLPFATWSRRLNQEDELPSLSESCSHVLLLISDSAIEEFVNRREYLTNKTLIHFSGQLSLPNIYSTHPLMTFSHSLYNLENYLQIPFILEENGPNLTDLLPGINNPYYKIPSSLKSYYHALCVLSGNFSCILWQKFYHEIDKRFHLPREIIFPYLKQTMSNLIDSPQGALTGPLARGDQKTITANLNALKNDEFQEIYQAFVNVFSNIL